MMNRILKLSMGFMATVILSACSAQSENLASSDEAQQTTAYLAEIADETTLFENGLGQQQTERYKLVVLPAQIDDAIEQNQSSVSSRQLSETVTHEITNALYDSHRFEILNYDEPSDLASDQNTNNTIYSNNRAQAEFYLKSTLSHLNAEETVRILKATGQGVEEKRVSAKLAYQLIESKTNKIVFSRTLHYQLKSTTYGEHLTTTMNNTIRVIAELVTHELLNEIYPIRVLKADREQIILDQPLAVDTQCDVIRIGKKIKDVYTNSVLGNEQTNVGNLLIIQTSSVLSYGKILEGQVAEGDICKIIPVSMPSAPELVIRNDSGGVILPYD